MSPIVGIRYHCTVCQDFDYCENCEEKFSESHHHPFLKIRNPNNAPVMFKAELNATVTNPNKKPAPKKVEMPYVDKRADTRSEANKFLTNIFGEIKNFFNVEKVFDKAEKTEKKEEISIDNPNCNTNANIKNINEITAMDDTTESIQLDINAPYYDNVITNENKKEETKELKKEENEKKVEVKYVELLNKMKNEFFLVDIPDDMILVALQKANGNMDEALGLLFA